MALRPLFPFKQAQYVQIFPLKPAPCCTLFAGLGNTNKSASFFFFLSDSRFVLATLSFSPFSLLPQTLWKIWQELRSLSSCSIRLQWFPGHLFLPGNDAADELARRGTLLVSSAIPCGLSPLMSRIHSSLFSDWRHNVSSKFFDTQAPSISTEELVLPRHARCVLSRLRCNGHGLLLSSYLYRIGRIKNPLCSACGHSSQNTSHLILNCLCSYGLFAPLALWHLSVSVRPLVQAQESYPASGVPWSSAMPPSVKRGRIITTTTTSRTNKIVERVREKVPSDRRRTVWMIADELSTNSERLWTIITKDLGIRNICVKFVPRLLNDEQKQHRVQECQDNLKKLETETDRMSRAATGDESWTFEYDPLT